MGLGEATTSGRQSYVTNLPIQVSLATGYLLSACLEVLSFDAEANSNKFRTTTRTQTKEYELIETHSRVPSLGDAYSLMVIPGCDE